MDILDYLLDADEADVAVTAKSSDKYLPAPEAVDELDLLMEEFSAPDADTSSKRDALMAMLRLTGRK